MPTLHAAPTDIATADLRSQRSLKAVLNRRLTQDEQRGTLLLDTLIAMAVLAIVFAIAYPNYAYARLQSSVSASVQQMNSIASGLALYSNDNGGNFPTGAAGTAINAALFGGAGNSYFNSTPIAPFANAGYTYNQTGGTSSSFLITDPSVYSPKSLLNGFRKSDGTACAGTCTTLQFDTAHSVYAS